MPDWGKTLLGHMAREKVGRTARYPKGASVGNGGPPKSSFRLTQNKSADPRDRSPRSYYRCIPPAFFPIDP